MQTIGVIGYGTVGKAVAKGLAAKGFQPKLYSLELVDTHIDDVIPTDMLFLCIWSPTINGKQDVKDVFDTCRQLESLAYRGTVAVKTTILPSNIYRLQKTCPHLRIVANPEFLTARTAAEDFLNPLWITVGGHLNHREPVARFYEEHWPGVPVIRTSATAAMFSKYVSNARAAVTISLMNDFRRLNDKQAYDAWSEVLPVLIADPRFGRAHIRVPGPDGRRGFAGACFPKDTEALLAEAEELDLALHVIQGALDTNQEVRCET